MTTSFLTSRNIHYILSTNPDAARRMNRTLDGYERVWVDAAKREMRWTAKEWLHQLARYHSPDDFLTKSKQARLHGHFTETYRELYGMAKKPTRTNFDRAEWKGFLERRLTDSELEAFDSEELDPAEILVSLDKLAGDGLEFKLSYSGKLKAYTATMIDQRHGSKTAGYALSAADEVGLKALAMLLYKYLVVLDGELSSLLDAERPARRG